jgi:hypothetical protein
MATAVQTAPASVINFACPTAKPILEKLIADLQAAGRELKAALDAQEEVGDPPSLTVKIYGGESEEVRLKRGDLPEQVIPGGPWHYRSLEDIKRDHLLNMREATTDEERAAVEARTDELLAEYRRQEKAHKRSIPKGCRAAERRVEKAHRWLSKAELAIINYRPTDAAEAVELLTLGGNTDRNSLFTPGEGELRHMMANAAAVLRHAGLS